MLTCRAVHVIQYMLW